MSFDVVVIGGGIIGCASARALDDAGLSVAIVEPGEPGGRASTAAAGLLTPQYEAEGPGPFFDLCNRARALYPDFAAALKEETSLNVELRREGMLVLALNQRDADALGAAEAWQAEQGLAVERVSAARARELEPLASPDTVSALFLPQDGQIDNVKVCRALVRSLRQREVCWYPGESVRALELGDSGPIGLRLLSGQRLAADRVVLAAGAWSGTLEGLPRALPVRPLRGQMAKLEASARTPRRILATLRGTYIVPRLDGRLLTGSTEEDVGFRDGATAGGVRRILEGALAIAPGLSESRLAAVWSGFRPGTPDGLPILGPDPDVPGLIYATGHFRNGILLAPITTRIVTALAKGTDPGVDLGPFRVDRFAA